MQRQWDCASREPKQQELRVGEPVIKRAPQPVLIGAPQPRAGVRRMKEYHPPVAGRDGLRLDFNENTLACSPRVIEALQNITAADLTRYPERGSVEAIVAASLGVAPAQVLLTNGVDEAIHVLCQAFLDRGDAMLLPVPTYSMYEVYGSAAEAQIDAVLATDNFRFPLDAILGAIHARTRLIAIANPNSPTGATVAREAIIAVAERAPEAIVLVDEAYYHFFGETVIDLIGKVPNLVVARTFSKAYGLAGLRLGALIAAEETMQWLRRVISPYSVNLLALACLPAALGDRAYLDWYVAEVKTARAELAQALTQFGLQHWPSEANFILTRIGAEHSAFVKAMRARGILTRDRSADPGCDGLVRITAGTREQMRQARGAIETSLKEIGWRG
jgi:histidinol-phosphate aminotransferase